MSVILLILLGYVHFMHRRKSWEGAAGDPLHIFCWEWTSPFAPQVAVIHNNDNIIL